MFPCFFTTVSFGFGDQGFSVISDLHHFMREHKASQSGAVYLEPPNRSVTGAHRVSPLAAWKVNLHLRSHPIEMNVGTFHLLLVFFLWVDVTVWCRGNSDTGKRILLFYLDNIGTPDFFFILKSKQHNEGWEFTKCTESENDFPCISFISFSQDFTRKQSYYLLVLLFISEYYKEFLLF